MNVKAGHMWPPVRGTVPIRNKKVRMKTVKGIIRLGLCDVTKHAIELVRVKHKRGSCD